MYHMYEPLGSECIVLQINTQCKRLPIQVSMKCLIYAQFQNRQVISLLWQSKSEVDWGWELILKETHPIRSPEHYQKWSLSSVEYALSRKKKKKMILCTSMMKVYWGWGYSSVSVETASHVQSPGFNLHTWKMFLYMYIQYILNIYLNI